MNLFVNLHCLKLQTKLYAIVMAVQINTICNKKNDYYEEISNNVCDVACMRYVCCGTDKTGFYQV